MADLTENFIVSSSPHLLHEDDTRSCMIDVIIALLPALCIGIYFFGWRSLTLSLVSVASCVSFEFLYQKITKRPSTVYDLSAIVTGLLLVLCVPATVPYWMVVIGSFFAIVVTKQLFGGIGKNFMNPALSGRIFMLAWANYFSVYPATLSSTSSLQLPIIGNVNLVNGIPDVVTSATPLTSLKAGVLPPDVSLTNVFFGNIAGSIGEVSAFILIIGGIYLILRGVISPRIPLCFIGTVAFLYFLFPGVNDRLTFMAYGIFSGGLMLGAIFMATDYSTSPVTPVGQCIFGVGCGLITYFIRKFGVYNEGVAFAILIMNSLVWSIDKISAPRRFGVRRFAHRRAAAQIGGDSK